MGLHLPYEALAVQILALGTTFWRTQFKIDVFQTLSKPIIVKLSFGLVEPWNPVQLQAHLYISVSLMHLEVYAKKMLVKLMISNTLKYFLNI